MKRKLTLPAPTTPKPSKVQKTTQLSHHLGLGTMNSPNILMPPIPSQNILMPPPPLPRGNSGRPKIYSQVQKEERERKQAQEQARVDQAMFASLSAKSLPPSELLRAFDVIPSPQRKSAPPARESEQYMDVDNVSSLPTLPKFDTTAVHPSS